MPEKAIWKIRSDDGRLLFLLPSLLQKALIKGRHRCAVNFEGKEFESAASNFVPSKITVDAAGSRLDEPELATGLSGAG